MVIFLIVAIIAYLFIGAGIATHSWTMLILGIIIALYPILFLYFIIREEIKTKKFISRTKNIFNNIYQLLPENTFNEYPPINESAASTGPTRSLSISTYNTLKETKGLPIKVEKESVYYNHERVSILLDTFAQSYYNPDKISEYFFKTSNHFPCNAELITQSEEQVSKKIVDFYSEINKAYLELQESFANNTKGTNNYNINVSKNYKRTKTTGLGFGIITNSLSHLLLYSAMDERARKKQSQANAPRYSTTENKDHQDLQDTYQKITALYSTFIEELRSILSNDELYKRTEAQQQEDIKKMQSTKKTKIKKIVIATSSSIASITLVIGIILGISITKANKYQRAQEYMAQDNYKAAMDILEKLGDYKNAEKLYEQSVYLYNEDYKEYITRYRIKKFQLPKTATQIRDKEFCDCDSLEEIIIPDTVTTIGEEAFAYCSSLTSVIIGNSVTTISEEAFAYCSSLTSVIIGNNVTTIGDRAFSSCDGLTSVVIGNSVTTIGTDTFFSCNGLTSVAIPDSITTIDESAFASCKNLMEIKVSPNNTSYQSIDGNLYTKNGTILVRYAAGKKQKEFIIPDSVTTIGEDAFYNCDGLTSVVIPDSVTTIGESAFSSCNGLTNIIIPDSVTTIGNRAFSSCDRLTSVVIPDSVTTIGDRAFSSCDRLTSVVIPDSVTTIGEYAFSWCSSLTSVVIPDSVTTIGNSAFSNCDKLMTIYCEVESIPYNWSKIWYDSYRSKVIWGYKEN